MIWTNVTPSRSMTPEEALKALLVVDSDVKPKLAEKQIKAAVRAVLTDPHPDVDGMTPSSAAIALRASCSAAGKLAEGGPSAVTGDLTAEPPLTPGEIRERLSGNLCRCGAYVNIVQAITATAAARIGR